MVPENGSVIDIYTPYVEFTFDEAVDTDSFEFLGFSVPFYLMVMGSGEPDLLEGGTVLRLPLATPLAAGTTLEMLIDSFDDIFGNTQNADLDYSITVGGTPDYYPVESGLTYGMSEYWYEGVIGNPTPTYSGDRPHYYRQTTLENGTFLLKDYTDYTFTNSYEWDIYSKTGSAIMIHGFHESSPMPIKADPTPGIDILFDDPLTWLKLPPRVTTWSESTTMTEPDKKATLDLDVDGRIIEKVDTLPLLMAGKVELPEFYSSGGKADAGLYWNDCWLTVIEHTVSMESEIFTVGVDSVWYAPGFGPVRINSYEENYEGDGGDWDWSRKEWFPVMEGIR